MKRIISIAAAAVMTFSLMTGCAQDDSDASSEISAAESTAAVTEVSMEHADNPVDFAKSLKMGWNLGNTFDATGSKDMSSETSWGQPETTKELIDFIKASGFTTIRIPVSWGNHTDENYTIDEAWMNRVNEVVDYAIDNGLYVIINSHHDCDYYYPTEEKFAESSRYIETVWTQIAERYKDYDEQLIFEAMNEPRLMGTNLEWWFSENDAKGVESIKCIMKLNQIFVDTVRSKGGKNETRFLMVPSNAASPTNALNKAFEMPTDSSNRLIVSVHAYTPYDFAMNEKGYNTWNGSKENELNFMDQLNDKFISKGYGVVIGEFGATNKDNLEDRVKWAQSYTGKAASLGIPCILWDNGGTGIGTENFGMINRRELSVYYPEILEAMLESYK